MARLALSSEGVLSSDTRERESRYRLALVERIAAAALSAVALMRSLFELRNLAAGQARRPVRQRRRKREGSRLCMSLAVAGPHIPVSSCSDWVRATHPMHRKAWRSAQRWRF